MRRSTSLLAMVAACAACSADTNPLAGDWNVERSHRAFTSGCPRLSLSPFTLTLRPGNEEEVDVGGLQYFGSSDFIDGNRIEFSTSEFAYPETSDMIVIRHKLEIQIADDQLVGAAGAHGDGSWIDCIWDIDVIATRATP